jgi:hypothetical protein
VVIWGGGVESYDDTLTWVTTHCRKDEWMYMMDIPTLSSLVKNDDQGYKALLENQSNSTKAGYASAKQPHISLSFHCKIQEVYGPRKSNKTHHPFWDAATYDKRRSTGTKQ